VSVSTAGSAAGPSDPAPLPVVGALIEKLSPALKAHADGLRRRGESLLALLATDMTPEGLFAEGFILCTAQRVISASASGGTLIVHAEVPTSTIVSIERVESHTACRVEAHTREKAVVLGLLPRPRCSVLAQVSEVLAPHMAPPVADQTSAPSSSTASGAANKGSIGGSHWHDGGWHGEDGGHGLGGACEKCGKPFPHRLGFCPDCMDKRTLYVRLLALARPYATPMAGSLALMLLITAIEMTQPLLTRILVDNVIPNADYRLFALVIGGIIAIYTFSSIFSGSRGYLMAWLGERIVHDMRTQVYAHVQRLSVDFYDERQTGWIMDRISADTSNLQNFLSEGFQDFIRDVMTIIVILGIMCTMNWQLTLATLAPAPIIFLLTMRFRRKVHRMYHSVWRKRSYMTSLLSSVIPGVRVVKAFAQEKLESDRFEKRSRSFMDASVRTARTYSTFSPVIDFITSLGFILVWSWGGYLVISGKGVTVGTLIAFIAYLWRFYGPVGNLSRFSQRLERASTSAQRVFDVLDTMPSVKDPETGTQLPPIKGEVVFQNVTFGYNPDEPVLKDVSFTVTPGEMIGLVGPSGAGKSTIINVLSRFYDVDQGSILVDGHDIRDVTMGSLHQQIGVVLQEPFLFHGTIGENIAYGCPTATHEQIMVAALAANAHDFIMNLPDGYDTLVGERGQRLSGGERQRISIARAILKNPRILILDEATSSVDTETEAAIQQAVERLVHGRTTFAIAHRFSTLRHADRLIVIDEGKVAEVGTHEELLAKEDGLFKRLVDIQTKSAQIVAVGG
jgi:ATP-binding cassette subfamily B protein